MKPSLLSELVDVADACVVSAGSIVMVVVDDVAVDVVDGKVDGKAKVMPSNFKVPVIISSFCNTLSKSEAFTFLP